MQSNQVTTFDSASGRIRMKRVPDLSGAKELTWSDWIVVESHTEWRALGRLVLSRGGDNINMGITDETLWNNLDILS